MTDHKLDYQTLDCLGLKCPLPVLKAHKHLKAMVAGEILRVLADDPMAPLDLEHMAQEEGHLLLEITTDHGQTSALIQKSPEKGCPGA